MSRGMGAVSFTPNPLARNYLHAELIDVIFSSKEHASAVPRPSFISRSLIAGLPTAHPQHKVQVRQTGHPFSHKCGYANTIMSDLRCSIFDVKAQSFIVGVSSHVLCLPPIRKGLGSRLVLKEPIVLSGAWHRGRRGPEFASSKFITEPCMAGFAPRGTTSTAAYIGSASSSRTDQVNQKQPSAEYKALWRARMDECDSLSAENLKKRLDYEFWMGFDIRSKGYGDLQRVVLKFKVSHPNKILLVQVGDFYEFFGYDAVIAAHYLNLSPMRQKISAGFPLRSINLHVDTLTKAGFSCVIIKEAPTVRQGPKHRFIAAIATPCRPALFHDGVYESTELRYPPTRPLLAISGSQRGYMIAEVDLDLSQVKITEALSQKSAADWLTAAGFAGPVYVHSDVAIPMQVERRKGAHRDDLAHALGSVEQVKCAGPHWLSSCLDAIRLDHGMPANAQFKPIKMDFKGRRKPLSKETAKHLGVLRSPGIFPLVEELISSAKDHRHSKAQMLAGYMKNLLLHPPPHSVAVAIHDVCTMLRDTDASLPAFNLTSVPANKISRLITDREANAPFFTEILKLLRSVQQMLASEQLDVLCSRILDIVAYDTSTTAAGVSGLRAAVEGAARKVEAVVQRAGGEDLCTRVAYASSEDSRTQFAGEEEEALLIPQSFFESLEGDFRGRVHREVALEVYEGVEAAANALERAIREDLEPAIEAQRLARLEEANNSTGRKRKKEEDLAMRYDEMKGRLYLKGTMAPSKLNHFVKPKDQKGLQIATANCYTTAKVEAALDEYIKAVGVARLGVASVLRELSSELERDLESLVCAASFALVSETLKEHTREAVQRGWSLPNLHSNAERGAWRMCDAWPYWMDRRGASTVLNSIHFEGLVLLTGPNMGGKSTVMRTSMSVALLGNCGLFVPAVEATLPFFDMFVVRMSNSDSPVEGRSAFNMEMQELESVLRECTANSAVALDEMGKGTEPSQGAGIAAATLEELDHTGVRGIFATHFHDILRLDGTRNARHVQYMCMEVRRSADGHNRPTWKVVDGTSEESLAIDVARNAGIPEKLLEKMEAYALQAQQLKRGQHSPTRDDVTMFFNEDDPNTLTMNPTSICFNMKLLNETEHEEINVKDHEQQKQKSLEDAKQLMGRVASRILKVDQDVLDLRDVSRGQTPAPNVSTHACVYIIQSSDGWFYCGETDDLSGRLESHANTGKYTHGVFLVVPKEYLGKSTARELEKQTILELQKQGFSLSSGSDVRHSKFAKPN